MSGRLQPAVTVGQRWWRQANQSQSRRNALGVLPTLRRKA